MLNTANLELKNFIDPELTWKTVTKGFRTPFRRSRKPTRTLNLGVQHDDESTKMGELSVSESEKLGVAVLGCRFAEIPFKKRRLVLHSPSTPPEIHSSHREESLSSQPWTSSPQPEDLDWKVENKRASGQLWCLDSVSNRELKAFDCPVAVQFSQGIEHAFVNGKLPEVSNEKVGYAEDFSGIALLAAAACNNSSSADPHNVKESPIVDDLLVSQEPVSSISATLLERTTTSSESGNLFLKESTQEDNIDDSMIQDNSVVVPQNFLDQSESVAGKMTSSKKDDRLHWDLNTEMDAWELPSDDLILGSQRNSSEDIPDVSVLSENPDKSDGYVRYRDTEHALELLKDSAANTEVSTQVISKDKELDTSSFPGTKSISNRPLSEEKINTSPTSVIVRTREACCGTSGMELGQVFIGNVHLGKHDVFLLDTTVSDKVACESDSKQPQKVSTKPFDSPDRTSPTELVSSATGQMSDVEYSASKSGNSGLFNPSSEHEYSLGLDTTAGEGQTVVAVDVEKKQDEEAPTADAIFMDPLLHAEMEFMPKSYECFGNVDLADSVDDGYGLDVFHGRHGPTVCVEKMTHMQMGYESPFEDGELRESDVYSCQENEIEGETECVDYESDYRGGDEFNAANQCTSEVGSDLNDNNGSFPGKKLQCGRTNSLRESSHSSSLNKCSGQNQLAEGCEYSTERTSEANNMGTQNLFAYESLDGLDVEGSSTGEVGSRASRGNFFSRVDGQSFSDALHRKHNVSMQRSRSSYDSCFHAGRSFGSEKYLERERPVQSIQHRNQGDSRNDYQNGYPPGTGQPRPRVVNGNSVAKIDGLTYRNQRRYTDYSLKGEYRPYIRRRSPANNDDGYSAPKRMAAARDDIHPIRSRGRCRIYRQGFSRVPREEYDGPMSNIPAPSSVRRPHYLNRRERSFSPVFNRGACFSRLRRKSRSRSRSPLTWHPQRERNMGVRRLIRSPDFRSEGRVGRIRIPFQKSNYAAEDEDAFKSPPRARFSPQRHSRWIDDQNCVPGHFRERKPPGRSFGWSKKYDFGGSGRIRSDDCFRSVIRPGRFTELSGGTGREHKYDCGNFERTKYRDSNTGGIIRQFRYDAEDHFEAHDIRGEDSCVKVTDRRDITRSAREERSPFKYSNERMYASGTKLSRIPDSDKDVSPSGE